MKTIAACLCLAFAAAACAEDPSAPSDHMKIFETCLETQCDQMTADGNSACQACESACFGASYDCDPSSACDESCSPRECSDYDRSTCVDQGFKVVPANNPDSSIADACKAVLQHVSDCGYTSSATTVDCDRYASDESADTAVAAYQCMTSVDCSAMGDSSSFDACAPTPSTFGDELCSALASTCPSIACASDLQARVDEDAAWLRPDALDAARSCLSQPSCPETNHCIEAWLSAVE